MVPLAIRTKNIIMLYMVILDSHKYEEKICVYTYVWVFSLYLGQTLTS